MNQIFSFVRPWLKQFRGRLALLVAAHILVSLAAMATAYLSGRFLDDLVKLSDKSVLLRYAGLISGIALAQLVLGFLCERLFLIIHNRCSYAITKNAVGHVQQVNHSFVQERSAAALNQQINNDADTVTAYCVTILQNISANLLTLAVPAALVFALQPWLSLVLVGLNLLYYLLYRLFYKPLYEARFALLEEQKDFYAGLQGQLAAVKFLQSHGIASWFLNRLDPAFESVLGKALKNQRAEYRFSGSDILVRALGTAAVFLLGGAAVLDGRLSIGELTIITSYMSMSLSATQYFFTLGSQTQNGRVCADRLKQLFSVPTQTNGTIRPGDVQRITCSSVRFGYRDVTVMSELNLELEKGRSYALVGVNGSGKSTLLNLLLGLHIDQYGGRVEYDGCPIEQLDMQAIRRELIGLSEQEPMLLEATLRCNLTLGSPDKAEDGELKRLCAILRLDSYVDALPEGLDSLINESSTNLSGGEKQKLSILRALLKKPKLLFLDEPSSALDRQSARELAAYLRESGKDRITVISTHDPELIACCDRVIRMPEGAIQKVESPGAGSGKKEKLSSV